MGKLGPSQKEQRYLRRNIAEAASLIGQEALLYQIESSEEDINFDDYIQFKEPVKINILFEDNPKPVLEKYNWFKEEEGLPYVAYITALDEEYNDIIVEKNCILELVQTQIETSATRFNIIEVRGDMINPLVWICKLAPYRYRKDSVSLGKKLEKDVRNQTGYKHLKR